VKNYDVRSWEERKIWGNIEREIRMNEEKNERVGWR
jgi:hypothetical protein